MARTSRRRGCRYDYVYALWDIEPAQQRADTLPVRQRLARFHSDCFASLREPPPRRFRKAMHHKARAYNRNALQHWLKQPTRDLLFYDARHCPDWQPM